MSDIEERLSKIIIGQFAVEEAAITPATRFQDDLDADSLEVVELIMSVEDAFDIEVPDEVVENIQTVGDLIAFIKSKQGKALGIGGN